jgi:16S rRNA (guanine527-N7)-methyltransferase
MTLGVTETIPDWLDVSRETEERLAAFAALVRKWNPAINLVSKTDAGQIWQRHILDSAQLFALAPQARLWADLGSGGGFPGLVIAILARQHNPGLSVHLMEADRRKATFLAQAIRQLDLTAVLHVTRIDELQPLGADVVSARALAPLPLLCGLAQRHLAVGGVALFPKGEGVAAELRDCAGLWQMEVTQIPSLTRADGVILKIRGLRHV